jgi:hypothetical protein
VAAFLRTWLEKEVSAPVIRYSANVSATHALTVSRITPSFESGD